MIIAEIIRYNQPELYRALDNIFNFRIFEWNHIEPLAEDETTEFKRTKYLMEERKGVAL